MFKDDFMKVINREQSYYHLTAGQLEILFNKWQGWLTHVKQGRIAYLKVDKDLENGLKALGLRVALVPIEEELAPSDVLTDKQHFMKEWERACRRLRKGETR